MTTTLWARAATVTSLDYRIGVFMLTAVCGLIDACCFLALGGVFAELMTGNLLLLAVSLGSGIAVGQRLVAYLGAILPFCLGAFVAGVVTLRSKSWGARAIGYPTEWAFIVVATIIAVLTTSQVSGSAAEQAILGGDDADREGTPLTARLVIVGLLAFAMGIHNALMRKHGVPDLATNVLTLTLTGFVAETSLSGAPASPRWKRRIGSILIFVVGAAAGAWLLRFHVAAPLIAASVLFTFALWPLVLGQAESGDRA
jgi:uncharacterized membrane protein YoaK (UPF0700 family)